MPKYENFMTITSMPIERTSNAARVALHRVWAGQPALPTESSMLCFNSDYILSVLFCKYLLKFVFVLPPQRQ